MFGGIFQTKEGLMPFYQTTTALPQRFRVVFSSFNADFREA